MRIKILLSILIICVLTSCKKEFSTDCYDKAYENEHKGDFCTMDCPGVIGCDGKKYCNECIMHTKGIKKSK